MIPWLFDIIGGDNGLALFGFLTFRAIMSALTALVVTLLIGPRVIAILSRYKIGQTVRSDGPETHFSKRGTPTMGGAMIIVAIVLSTLLWCDLSNRFVWLTLGTLIAFGGIGFIDDYRKLVKGDSRGLPARWKYLAQSLFALGIGLFLVYTAQSPVATTLYVPFFKSVAIPLGTVSFLVLTYFVVVGSSNAVNLTDGLDGLAIMPTVFIAVALGAFAYLTGNTVFSEYLNIPYVAGTGEVTVFLGAMAGAGLGFLWFNTYPAMVFMGDIGSLALGAALGVVAVIVRQELVLFVMAGVFVVETLSVVIQVASFKLTGRRVFRMAPLHHHYELKGWPEPRVIVRFWIISVILVLIGLLTLKVR